MVVSDCLVVAGFDSLTLPQNGSRRSPHRLTPSLLATCEHARCAVLRCCGEGNGRRSGASLCFLFDDARRRLGVVAGSMTPRRQQVSAGAQNVGVVSGQRQRCR